MSKNGLLKLICGFRNYIRKHSPEILTGVGIAGMITTTVMAVQATPKALSLIDEKKEKQKTDKLKVIDKVKTVWKCYFPSVLVGALSITCMIGANAVNSKRSTALATAYSLSESALKIYQDKVIETIGEKEEQKVRDAVAREHVEKNPIATREVIITDKGNTLCLDPLSGRYFKSDIETLKKAVNELNRKMTVDMYISLNDFYEEIGLAPTKTGDDIGWNVNRGLIDLSFSSQLAKDGTPCLVVDHRELPQYEYE